MVATTPGAPPTVAAALISVSGSDIAGLDLVPGIPARVSGPVVLNDGAATSLKGVPLQVTLLSADPDVYGFGVLSASPAPVREDLSFELHSSPGRRAWRSSAAAAVHGRWRLCGIRGSM